MADAPPTIRNLPEIYSILFDEAYDLSRGSVEYWFRQGVRHVVEAWDIDDIARELERYGDLERWLTSDPDAVAALDEFRALYGTAYLGPRDEDGRRTARHRARLVQSLAAGADAAVQTSAIPDSWYSLDAWVDRAISWVDTEGASRVTAVSDSMKDGIRQILREAYEVRGTGREGIARALVALEDADGVRFGLDRRRAKAYMRSINEIMDTPGLSDARRRQLISRRHKQLLRSRARLIAHTEAVEATNQGQIRAYQVAAEEGQIDTNLYILEWVARVNRCPRCGAFDTSTREIGSGRFVSDGSGPKGVETAENAPLHPGCFCFARSIRRKEAKRLPATVSDVNAALPADGSLALLRAA